MEFCEIKHILAENKAYFGRTISSPQNSRSEYLRETESARRVHRVPVPNGRHRVWQLRRPQGSRYLNVELQIPTAARIQPLAGQDMLYFRPKYALNHTGCDLNHKMSVSDKLCFQKRVRAPQSTDAGDATAGLCKAGTIGFTRGITLLGLMFSVHVFTNRYPWNCSRQQLHLLTLYASLLHLLPLYGSKETLRP